MRIGILGTSPIAVDAIVNPSLELGHDVVAVASRSLVRAEEFARAHGIPHAFDGYSTLLERDDVDLVYLCMENSAHATWARACIAAGFDVLVEKPFAMNGAEAELVVDAAARAGVRVFDGFHYQYHPVFRELCRMVSSGEVGEVLSVQASTRMVAPPVGSSRWSFDKGGGALMDLGCYGLHAIELIGRLLGEQVEVASARAKASSPDARVDASADVSLLVGDRIPARVVCDIDVPLWQFVVTDGLRRIRTPQVRTRGMSFELVVHGSERKVQAMNFVLPHLDERLIVTKGHRSETMTMSRTPTYRYQLEYVAALCEELSDVVQMSPANTMHLVDASRKAAGLPATAGSER